MSALPPARRNRDRILQRFAIAAVAAIVVAPLPFMMLEMRQIQDGAIEALERELCNDGTPSPNSWNFPSLPTATLNPSKAPTANEDAFRKYLASHQGTLPQDKVLHFAEGGANYYFYLAPSERTGSNLPPLEVRYIDISFAYPLMLRITAIFAIVDILLATCLIIFQKRISNALDDNERIAQAFFANASHELKTPLTVISLQADSLRRGVASTENACESITEAAEHMETMVDSILQLGRVDAGANLPCFAPVDVRETLYDVLRTIEPLASKGKLQLKIHLPRPLLCEADESMLYAVFANLLSNAVRYAEKGIEVAGHRAGQSLFITVANDGTSMTDEEASCLFERFSTGPHGQTGIGLSLAKEYVRLHGGSLRAIPGNGHLTMEVVLKKLPH